MIIDSIEWPPHLTETERNECSRAVAPLRDWARDRFYGASVGDIRRFADTLVSDWPNVRFVGGVCPGMRHMMTPAVSAITSGPGVRIVFRWTRAERERREASRSATHRDTVPCYVEEYTTTYGPNEAITEIHLRAIGGGESIEITGTTTSLRVRGIIIDAMVQRVELRWHVGQRRLYNATATVPIDLTIQGIQYENLASREWGREVLGEWAPPRLVNRSVTREEIERVRDVPLSSRASRAVLASELALSGVAMLEGAEEIHRTTGAVFVAGADIQAGEIVQVAHSGAVTPASASNTHPGVRSPVPTRRAQGESDRRFSARTSMTPEQWGTNRDADGLCGTCLAEEWMWCDEVAHRTGRAAFVSAEESKRLIDAHLHPVNLGPEAEARLAAAALLARCSFAVSRLVQIIATIGVAAARAHAGVEAFDTFARGALRAWALSPALLELDTEHAPFGVDLSPPEDAISQRVALLEIDHG